MSDNTTNTEDYGQTVEDYEEYTGREYTESEKKTIQRLLDEAKEAILTFTDNRWTNSRGSNVPVDNLQCRIVYRVFENPDNITAEGADGVTITKNVVTTTIELTDTERDSLVAYGVKVKTVAPNPNRPYSTNLGNGVLW